MDILLVEVYTDHGAPRDMEGILVVVEGSQAEVEDSQLEAADAAHEVPCLVGASSLQSEEVLLVAEAKKVRLE